MRVLFIFGTGSEVRQFLHSGIIANLVGKGIPIFISSKQSILDEINKAHTKVIELPWFDVSFPSGILSRITKTLDLAFEKKYIYKAWSYNNRQKEITLIESLIASFVAIKPVNELFLFIERKLQKANNVLSKEWIDLLKSNHIERVVVNAARNYPAVLYAAQKLKIPVIIPFHTNKDIYAQGRINFRFKKYGVWNQEMANELIHYNPFINKHAFEVIGCSHFSYLSDSNFDASDEAFSSKYKVNPAEDFIVLYTAAGPGVILNETSYIDDIRESLESKGISRYKIIVRSNPMDFTPVWDSKQKTNVIVLKPQWHYDPVAFFNYTKLEDLREFHALMKHCHVCINIPSTVTVECAITRVPIINICYNNDFNKGADILKFWNAPFYRNVIKYKAAIPVFSKSELQMKLVQIKSGLKIINEQKLFLENEIGIVISELTTIGSKFIVS